MTTPIWKETVMNTANKTNKDAFDLWWEWAESRSIAQLRNFLGETVN